VVHQTKATDFKAVSYQINKLPSSGWFISKKLDGNYINILIGNRVRFFTSSGKEFYVHPLADLLSKLYVGEKDYILECEYIGETDGKLGSRRMIGELTTYRTNFYKGIDNNIIKPPKIYIFDVIIDNPFMSFKDRLKVLHNLSAKLPKNNLVSFAEHTAIDLNTALDRYELLQTNNTDHLEGYMLKHTNHTQDGYIKSKRVKTAIKLKYRFSRTLTIVDTEKGKGKYLSKIGAVVVYYKGKYLPIGSGLTDIDRNRTDLVGRLVTIEYEDIHKGKFIQPTIKGIK